jgi:hypothetical protein
VAAPQAGAKSQTAVVAQAAVFQKTHAITHGVPATLATSSR